MVGDMGGAILSVWWSHAQYLLKYYVMYRGQILVIDVYLVLHTLNL